MDQPRLEDLVEEHRSTLHTYVSYRLDRALRQKEPVSDIVQSALREVLANPGRFTYQGPEALRAYLVRAVEHKIANKRRYWQSQKRSAGTEPDGDLTDEAADPAGQTPSDAAAQREVLARLAAAFDKLSEEDRKLLTMRRFAGLSTPVIAAELGLTPSKVRHNLGRIMTVLSQELGHGWGPDGRELGGTKT